MKRKELVTTLEFVGQALSTNNLVPIFGCYCFEPGQVYAFNDQLGIRAKCEVKYTFAAHGATLLGLLQCGSTDTVSVVVEENTLGIQCGKALMDLPCFGKEDFIFEPPV